MLVRTYVQVITNNGSEIIKMFPQKLFLEKAKWPSKCAMQGCSLGAIKRLPSSINLGKHFSLRKSKPLEIKKTNVSHIYAVGDASRCKPQLFRCLSLILNKSKKGFNFE
jgi:hypothetical protein